MVDNLVNKYNLKCPSVAIPESNFFMNSDFNRNVFTNCSKPQEHQERCSGPQNPEYVAVDPKNPMGVALDPKNPRLESPRKTKMEETLQKK